MAGKQRRKSMSMRKVTLLMMVLLLLAAATAMSGDDAIRKTTATAGTQHEKATLRQLLLVHGSAVDKLPRMVSVVRLYRRKVKNPT
jgi:hypothetical protein